MKDWQPYRSSVWLAALGILILVFFTIRPTGLDSDTTLMGGVALALVWKQRRQLALESGLVATLLGSLLVVWVVLRQVTVTQMVGSGSDVLSAFSPVLAALGLALLASGGSGLGQYWRSLVCLIPASGIMLVLSTRLLDAKLTHYLFWYLGMAVSRNGTQLVLPQGSVLINASCSSLGPLIFLLKMWVIVDLLWPYHQPKRWLTLVMALGIGLAVNTIRIAGLALLVNAGQRPAFNFWHGSTGAQITTLVMVVLFIALYRRLGGQSWSTGPA